MPIAMIDREPGEDEDGASSSTQGSGAKKKLAILGGLAALIGVVAARLRSRQS